MALTLRATAGSGLDLAQIRKLALEMPVCAGFPILKLAPVALQGGGRTPTILKAANEIAAAGAPIRGIGARGDVAPASARPADLRDRDRAS